MPLTASRSALRTRRALGLPAPAAALLAAAGVAAPLAGQGTAPTTVTADAAVATSWVWRGVTFANHPVAQAALVVASGAAGGTLTLAAWANAEIGTAQGPHDITMLPAPHGGPALTGTAVWAEYARDARPGLGLAAGVTGYVYPAKTGFAEGYNTAELYARLALPGALAPRLTVYQDVRRVQGAYAEGSVSHAVGPAPHPVTVGVQAGLNLGQGPAVGQSAYFTRAGLTHVDVSATRTWTVAGVGVAPAVHVQRSVDGAARLTAADRRSNWKLWGGLTLTHARRLGAAH